MTATARSTIKLSAVILAICSFLLVNAFYGFQNDAKESKQTNAQQNETLVKQTEPLRFHDQQFILVNHKLDDVIEENKKDFADMKKEFKEDQSKMRDEIISEIRLSKNTNKW